MAAPAKVNLKLTVGTRRADGFHEIDTLFQAIGLSDRVGVQLTRGGISLEMDGPDLGPIHDNLAFRAAQFFVDRVALDVGVAVRLEKRIPAGAGLGGGSSDAAAVLKALNALTESPLEIGELSALAAELGSDVPFFLGTSPLARGRGRGEVLQWLRPLPPAWVVLVTPDVHVATAPAYASLARPEGEHTVIDQMGGALDTGSWEGVMADASNDFQPVVAEVYPQVAEALAALADVDAEPALLSGSGAACFWLTEDEAAARAVCSRLESENRWPVYCVPTLMCLPSPRPLVSVGG